MRSAAAHVRSLPAHESCKFLDTSAVRNLDPVPDFGSILHALLSDGAIYPASPSATSGQAPHTVRFAAGSIPTSRPFFRNVGP
jgi:hypothetical protein